jgi:hypothetical protein
MVGPGVVPPHSKFNDLHCQTALTAATGAKDIFLRCQTGKVHNAKRRCLRTLSNGEQSGHRADLLQADVHVCQSQRPRTTAVSIPSNCAAMKAVTPVGAMPAKVSDSERAMVTAGLANDVEAVNQ